MSSSTSKFIAPIRAQFLCSVGKTDGDSEKNESEPSNEEGDQPPTKRVKLRGLNKNRPREKRPDISSQMCMSFMKNNQCIFEEKCKFSHDIWSFWKNKPEDFDNFCPIFDIRGFCCYGVACRFAKSHVDENLNNLCKDGDLTLRDTPDIELNKLDMDLKVKLQKRNYIYSASETYLAELARIKQNRSEQPANNNHEKNQNGTLDEIDPDLLQEKRQPKRTKKEDWTKKLFLAPLTTVGNLPFRRICVDFGAEITCGEMALATELLQGKQSEWALLRRHPAEKFFGVQLCGGHADTLTKCAQLLVETCQVDFIDLNVGCPIDLICNKGAGCMLMNRTNRLGDIVTGINSVIGDVPLTLKIRTGVYDGKNVAHSLVQNFDKWNVSACILHGRSREQRYTKSADWDYINTSAAAANPVPLFGCGDVLSYEDYYHRLETSPDVSGIVIARGALIKPWIFTEIKEKRHWDISSSERLDILKKYVNFCLEHWGSDQSGVDKTRRFLLEWLSFLYRYIPVGLLERLPQRINERPPPYFGRDDLETLMASNNCKDWIKISEILLGPIADDFQFLPKHKANAYG